MTELQHLQKVILSIAKDIDILCRKNNIEYYLLGGSCIGAIRHHGFIPWDDDLDIIMTRNNYLRFLDVCRTQLDGKKYTLQEGLKDWALDFSKIRLKGTCLHEPEDDYANDEMHGIYVDIFPMDNVSNNNMIAFLQYVLAKYLLCYQLGERSYKGASLKKKLLIFAAFPLKLDMLRMLVASFIKKYNKKRTNRYGFFFGRTKYRTAITHKHIYGTPKYVLFEDTYLPIAECYHEYLTQMFGDYMQLPPIEQQKGLHLISVDFGIY